MVVALSPFLLLSRHKLKQVRLTVGAMTKSDISKRFTSILVSMVILGGCGDSKREMPQSLNLQLEAKKAMAAGDTAKALEALTGSIESKPTVWALLERAKLHLAQGDEDAAKADCLKALEVEPENRDIKWLREEIKKPESKRFKGRNKLPPSSMK